MYYRECYIFRNLAMDIESHKRWINSEK